MPKKHKNSIQHYRRLREFREMQERIRNPRFDGKDREAIRLYYSGLVGGSRG